MKNVILMFLAAALVLISSCASKPALPAGSVKLLIGNAVIQHGKSIDPVILGQTVFVGDTITTGGDGVVIVTFDTTADAEIQPDSSFEVREFGDKIKNLYPNIFRQF